MAEKHEKKRCAVGSCRRTFHGPPEARLCPRCEAEKRGQPSQPICRREGCGNRFVPKHGPQKYCDGCRAEGYGGTNSHARTSPRRKRQASDSSVSTPIGVAAAVLELLQPLAVEDRRRALKHVELELGEGE